jgi:hypothetical protein
MGCLSEGDGKNREVVYVVCMLECDTRIGNIEMSLLERERAFGIFRTGAEYFKGIVGIFVEECNALSREKIDGGCVFSDEVCP